MKKAYLMAAASVMAACIMCSGCSSADRVIARSDPDASIATIDEVSLSDADMEESLKALANRIQAQLRGSDPTATAIFEKNEDGSCEIAIHSNGEDSEVETYDSVSACFTSYLEAGFLDFEGNIRGFTEKIPEEKESESAALSRAEEIIATAPAINGDGEMIYPENNASSSDNSEIENSETSDSANMTDSEMSESAS